MIQSMTGYSRISRKGPKGIVTIELRSTNHRYLELEQRLPDGLNGFEAEIARYVRERLGRGRVELSVSIQMPQASTRRVVIDEALAHAYHERLLELKGRFGLSGSITLDHLLALPHVLGVKDERIQSVMVWPDIRTAVEAAVQQLLAARRAEGRRLVKDIRAQMAGIRTSLKRIRARLPRGIAEQRRRLQERLKTLLGSHATFTSAQVREALAGIKDTDIHEELVRLESHLTQMDHVLTDEQAVGKKLDFIAQELVREANTIGSKANDTIIAQSVIEVKGAIEKIREQSQNLQ